MQAFDQFDGMMRKMEHETGLEPATPRWQGDAGLDFIEFVAWSGHIGSFWPIVVDAALELPPPPP
jgi:hypothetical protein